MPESKTRKSVKKKDADKASKTSSSTGPETKAAKPEVSSRRTGAKGPGTRQWVVPTFITVGLLGVAWLVLYYITASLAIEIPVFTGLGGWNILIGIGLIAGSFGIATLWK